MCKTFIRGDACERKQKGSRISLGDSVHEASLTLRERERKLGGSALDCCAVSGRFVWALSPTWTIKVSDVSLEAGTYPPEHAAPARWQTAVCEGCSPGAKAQDFTAQRLRPRVNFTPCSGMAAACVLLAAMRSHGQNYEIGSLIYVSSPSFSATSLFLYRLLLLLYAS